MQAVAMLMKWGVQLTMAFIKIALLVLAWVFTALVVPAAAAALGYAMRVWQDRAEREVEQQSAAAATLSSGTTPLAPVPPVSDQDPWLVTGGPAGSRGQTSA